MNARLGSLRDALLLSLAALQLASGCSSASPPAVHAPSTRTSSSEAPESRRWVAENSEIVQLSSTKTGRDYDIIVGLPPSFDEEPDRRYPALYLTDGQWDFALVNMLAGGLRYDKVVPEFLIVAVTYAGDDPDYNGLRREDYTPTRFQAEGADAPSGGDAKKFLSFLEGDVIPMVEKRYRGDPGHRILSGHSLGGLFALYSLFEKPDLFNTVLSLSPAVGWDSRYLFGREQSFHTAHPQLHKRVWVSVGDSEWPHFTKAAVDFSQQFEASAYQGIALETRVVKGEAHAGVKPESYNRAIRFAFQPWADTQRKEN